MEMTSKQRSKVKALDISFNQNLSFDILISIMGHLPNLSTLTARNNGWKYLPSNLFLYNKKIKNLDISNNQIQCVRNVFKNLKLKKMAWAENPILVNHVGAKKGKKSQLPKYIAKFNKLDRDLCETEV